MKNIQIKEKHICAYFNNLRSKFIPGNVITLHKKTKVYDQLSVVSLTLPILY